MWTQVWYPLSLSCALVIVLAIHGNLRRRRPRISSVFSIVYDLHTTRGEFYVHVIQSGPWAVFLLVTQGGAGSSLERVPLAFVIGRRPPIFGTPSPAQNNFHSWSRYSRRLDHRITSVQSSYSVPSVDAQRGRRDRTVPAGFP